MVEVIHDRVCPGTSRVTTIFLPNSGLCINQLSCVSLPAAAVKKAIPEIEKVVEYAVIALKNGNRIIYVGAGTSGRLGILDASEIPPTFSAPREWFTGVIAGGTEAVFRSVESAEDMPKDAERDLDGIGIKKGDVLIGIASSGTTPYVIAGLKYAKQIGCRRNY